MNKIAYRVFKFSNFIIFFFCVANIELLAAPRPVVRPGSTVSTSGKPTSPTNIAVTQSSAKPGFFKGLKERMPHWMKRTGAISGSLAKEIGAFVLHPQKSFRSLKKRIGTGLEATGERLKTGSERFPFFKNTVAKVGSGMSKLGRRFRRHAEKAEALHEKKPERAKELAEKYVAESRLKDFLKFEGEGLGHWGIKSWRELSPDQQQTVAREVLRVPKNVSLTDRQMELASNKFNRTRWTAMKMLPERVEQRVIDSLTASPVKSGKSGEVPQKPVGGADGEAIGKTIEAWEAWVKNAPKDRPGYKKAMEEVSGFLDAVRANKDKITRTPVELNTAIRSIVDYHATRQGFSRAQIPKETPNAKTLHRPTPPLEQTGSSTASSGFGDLLSLILLFLT